MKPFTKKELKIVFWVLAFIFVAGFFNFKMSLLRSRDDQRKRDIGKIVSALEIYHEEFGFYPPSNSKGEIVACKKDDKTDLSVIEGLSLKESLDRVFMGCEWGKDSLADISDDGHEPYLKTIPSDPNTKDGANYLYISNINYFQLFAHLESEEDVQYKQEVKRRELMCGTKICNFGKSLNNTPLDVKIEEYEKQLLESNL